MLELPTSQFFAGFRLKELDEVDATAPSAMQKLGLGFKGLLWFVFLLWPYMTFGLVCSFGAQLLIWSDSDPFASPFDIKVAERISSGGTRALGVCVLTISLGVHP